MDNVKQWNVCVNMVFELVLLRCPQVAAGKDEERWRVKNEGALFKRWKRTASVEPSAPALVAPATPPAQPSDLLKFLAIVSIHYLCILYLPTTIQKHNCFKVHLT